MRSETYYSTVTVIHALLYESECRTFTKTNDKKNGDYRISLLQSSRRIYIMTEHKINEEVRK